MENTPQTELPYAHDLKEIARSLAFAELDQKIATKDVLQRINLPPIPDPKADIDADVNEIMRLTGGSFEMKAVPDKEFRFQFVIAWLRESVDNFRAGRRTAALAYMIATDHQLFHDLEFDDVDQRILLDIAVEHEIIATLEDVVMDDIRTIHDREPEDGGMGKVPVDHLNALQAKLRERVVPSPNPERK